MAFPDRAFELYLEAIPDAALAVAPDGTIVHANSQAEALFGYPAGGLASRPHDLLVPEAGRKAHGPGLAAFFVRPARHAMANGRTIAGLRADGSEFPAECFLSPMEAEGGPYALAVVRDLTERRRAEQALRDGEARYRQLFEANPHPMWVYDLETLAFLAVNDAAVRKYGYSREEFLARTLDDIRPAEDVDALHENVARVSEGLDEAGLWRHVTKDGAPLDVEIVSHTLDWGGRRAELVLAHDVTERRRAEERLRYVTRLYAFLSQINQAIVRLQGREELFEALCRVAVDYGRFRMAWVGVLDEATGAVAPVAHAGHEEGYLGGLSIRLGAEPAAQGPTGAALRGGSVSICDDIASDPRMRPWRDEALRRGYGSSSAIPFRLRGRVVGTVNLYAAEPNFFTEEERHLLEEIGVEVSFALDAMETERERRRMEETLAQSERNYRTLFDAATDAIFLLDLDGNFIDVNRTGHVRLGYTKPEMLSLHVGRLDSAEFAARVPERLAQIARQGEAVFESAHVRKDGSVMPVEVNSRLLEYQGRQVYFSVIRDITERKQAEEELRHRTRGLATLLDASQSVAATLDLDTVLQAAAEGALRLFGLDTAAVYLLEGESLLLRATAPALPPDFPEELCRSHLSDHPHIREALASRQPLLVPDLAAVELTAAEHDVTRLRNLRSILYLPLLAGDRPEGVLVVASTGEPREITEAEIAQCRTLANLAALAVANARLYQAGQKHAAELEQQVAERRRTEEEKEGLQTQLAHAQKMEAVGRLAGGVAHDFNNMLAVILGRAELALRKAGPEGPLAQDLSEILQAAERSAVLTRQLLAFARRQAVSPRVLDLNEAVSGMLSMLRRLIGEDVDLAWVPGDGVWNVWLDPSQLDQLLANLVVNARDAIAGTGRITLETRNVALGEALGARGEALAPGEYVLLLVSDDGCGMSEDTLAHLFEPFFTTKGPGQGTGLGLATVYGVVHQNGGYVDAQSSPGMGTTFRIYLPRAKAEAAAPQVPEGTPPPGRGETVLLVEDEDAILTLGREMLSRLGYNVLSAGTPGEALRLAEAHAGAIHLLVTDVVMPGMNGRELSEKLAAVRPGLRCLFLSGYTADVIANRGVLAAGVLLLEKPFSLRQLAAKVREALG